MEDSWPIQDRGKRCWRVGFVNYEVSAYARRGMQCRHNMNYWEFGDYLGIGAGAHGKITDPPRYVLGANAASPRSTWHRPAGAHTGWTRELVGDFC